MKVTIIDINGTPHKIDKGVEASFRVFARWSYSRYLVMVSNDGDLFDPLDINNRIDKIDRQRGSPFWKLKTCSKECYEKYIIFLRTKNRTPYLMAQRRFRNDFV